MDSQHIANNWRKCHWSTLGMRTLLKRRLWLNFGPDHRPQGQIPKLLGESEHN